MKINIYKETEKEWRKSLPKYSAQELLDIFPEAKEIIPVKIGETEAEIKAFEKEVKDLLNETRHSKDAWFAEEFAKVFLIPNIVESERRLKCLKRFLLCPDENNNDNQFQDKIQTARNYPIYDIAVGKLNLISTGKKYKALCPFHQEKTPSFYIYPETNRFYCFGCLEKGNVITLTMHLYGVDFKEAVRMLQN